MIVGFLSAFGRGDYSEQINEEAELQALAKELGVNFRRSGKHYRDLTGVIAGHRVVATMTMHAQGVTVDFESGLQDLSIRSRSQKLKTYRVDVPTGDPIFDASFRLLLDKDTPTRMPLEYLTPERRRTIMALDEAVPAQRSQRRRARVRGVS